VSLLPFLPHLARLRLLDAVTGADGAEGLSRMWGNPPVRFLGEGAAAPPPPLPDPKAAMAGKERPV